MSVGKIILPVAGLGKRLWPLTLATPQSLYLRGDYNTGGGSPTQVRPASVWCDMLHLLSNGYVDGSKGPSWGPIAPAASETTYNTAAVLGIYPTRPYPDYPIPQASYDGGLGNHPRLHENWSGKTLRFRGSFVNFWLSRFATLGWDPDPYHYQPPNPRLFEYETLFDDPNSLPPFTPVAVSTHKISYREGY